MPPINQVRSNIRKFERSNALDRSLYGEVSNNRTAELSNALSVHGAPSTAPALPGDLSTFRTLERSNALSLHSDHSTACGSGEHSNVRTFERSSVQRWYVLWTRSNCEQIVYDQLAGRGFHLFLPQMDVWSRRRGIRHRSRGPMFPGYLFLHHMMDKASYIQVCKARGLVRLLGERWDGLAVVPGGEIEAIQRVDHANLSVLPHPYLREGQRVRITGGLLAGVEGILLRSNSRRGLLVISINLLQRSVAVEVDCTLVAAA